MERMNLNGTWLCRLPDHRQFAVQVPGCWDTYVPEKNIGTPVSLSREFQLSRDSERRYFLYFGGVSYFCEVFVNGDRVGSHEGMWEHFSLDVTDSLRDGENTLRLEITKPGYGSGDPFPVREVLSGFIPDVLCTFGGIWDDVRLEACGAFRVCSHYARGNSKGEGEIHAAGLFFAEGAVSVAAEIFSPAGVKVLSPKPENYRVKAGEHAFSLSFRIPDALLWDTEKPQMYRYTLTVTAGNHQEVFEKSFGFRDIAYRGTQILLNGQPVYARGILHWGCYDETIVPNPSCEEICKEITQCRHYGFNMIKHCLYIPREQYFALADEMGMLLWVELPLWLPDATPALPERIRREYPGILEQLAGHPSLVMLSLGCELDSRVDSGILEEMYHLARDKSDALVRDNSGSGECYGGLAVDFADFFDYHFYGDLQNMENLMEAFTPAWRNYRPWLFGEFCDSDTLRDLKEVRARKGADPLFWEVYDPAGNPVCRLKPDFFLHRHDGNMEKSGIRKEFSLLKELSYNHSLVHRKVTLEYTRSFPEIGGYNITALRDVPIATSGIFDDAMEPKFHRERFIRSNNDLVLLPAWDLTRVWVNADRVMNKERYNFFSGDTYGLHILLSNYGRIALESPRLNWELLRGTEVLYRGEHRNKGFFAVGDVKELGYISFVLPEVGKPETLVLSVSMTCGDVHTGNSWPVFVYDRPRPLEEKIGLYDPANVFPGIEKFMNTVPIEDEQEIEAAEIVIASRLTPKIRNYVRKGGRVFFVQRNEGFLPVKKVAFWREGMLRRFPHPAVDAISYQEWFDDLRFFSVGTDTAFATESLELEPFENIQTLIRRYDCREWQATDYMLELRLGDGAILATTLRLEGNMGKQPFGIGSNTLGQWLLMSSLKYLREGLKGVL